MLKLLKDIDGHRELLSILVSRNLKIRYKRSALGFLWTLLNPLFFIVIYVNFLKILRFATGEPMFLPRLVTGILIWQFLVMCTGDALYAVLGNQSLVTKAAFPRSILPISTVVANVVNLALSLVVLFVYLLVLRLTGLVPDITFTNMGILPIVVMTHVALCLGLCLILSCLNIFFRDTEHLLGVVMLAWFFMTPIIYPFTYIPAAYQKLAFLNPMCGIVVGYRAAFLGTGIMAPNLVMMSFAVSWITLIIGVIFFQKVEGNLAEHM